MENVVNFSTARAERLGAPRLPRLIGHRGARAYAPENTLVGLHTAADMGVEWVEIDVKLSRDGEPIVFHDEELSRITGVSGLVADTDWSELKQLDAGAHFSHSFVDERIPHLEEALSTILDRGMGVNLEIKPCPGREKETAEIMLDCVSRIWPDAEDEGDVQPPLISSFQAVSLETALEMMPAWPRGYLIATDIEESMRSWREKAEHLQIATLHFDRLFLTEKDGFLDEFLAAGYPLLSYTVNDMNIADTLFQMGVVSIFTDKPDLLEE